VNDGGTLLYRASKYDCDACELKPRCCPRMPARKVPRSIYENARDVARDIAKTEAYVTSRRERKKIEMLFAHLEPPKAGKADPAARPSACLSVSKLTRARLFAPSRTVRPPTFSTKSAQSGRWTGRSSLAESNSSFLVVDWSDPLNVRFDSLIRRGIAGGVWRRRR
jgi:hypothetical protein